MTDVTLDQMREAMQRVDDVLSGRVVPPPCSWGCPDGVHGQPKPIPDQTTEYAVYGFFGWDDRCLYVGQTRDLNSRCYQHTYRIAYFHAKEVRILAGVATRAEALRAERDQIKARDPLFNIKHSPSHPNVTQLELHESLTDSTWPPPGSQVAKSA